MLRTFKGVIFDMDGLMLDTEPIYRKSMQQAAVELGYDIDDQLQNRLTGRNISDWRTTLIQIFGENYPQFSKRRRQIWEQHVQEVGVTQKSGLVDLLNQLDEDNLPKGIATSSSRPDALLCLGELTGRFEVIVTGDEVKQGKPAPDIFLLATQRLALSPEHCLVLEDSESGAQAALTAGMSVILVPDLNPPPNELVAQVQRVCSSLHEVRKLFRSRNVPTAPQQGDALHYTQPTED
jgi:HAD superfamily hydrolase (TIGR01509 family)